MISADQVTEDMIEQCIQHPVRSRHHQWRPGYVDQQAYDVLNSKGRTLYDNLRTQFDIPHGEAFSVAFERFGFSNVVFL